MRSIGLHEGQDIKKIIFQNNHCSIRSWGQGSSAGLTGLLTDAFIFFPETNTVELELLEISGEIYLRCVNRGKLLNPKIRSISNAFTNGLKHVVIQMIRAYKHNTPIENNLQEGNFNTSVDVNIAQRISKWCEFNDIDISAICKEYSNTESYESLVVNLKEIE